ncbi:hypothetical protein AHMF7605_06855 [Adhaeribacter arboris]|uniref:Uncharacterized protein n=1 Tax=Adhaeribacter arboris TaxID=2072846 RepID=A0A2T2YCN5_9BACT|nr:hypothetical protein [Adhaeribacter arboris]PSR53269.1 hypothetical protein AHMF7605_06855 [Adhaeribacter arboris]
MVALEYFIDLIRIGGLQEWEALHLTDKLEDPYYEFNIENGTASYIHYDEYGQPFTILISLKLLVEKEQKKALHLISWELKEYSTRIEKKEYLFDILEQINTLINDVSQNDIYQKYPSIAESLLYLEQEIKIVYNRLLKTPSQNISLDIKSSHISKTDLPTTFTYTALKQAHDINPKFFRERFSAISEAEKKLNVFSTELINTGLVSEFSVRVNKTNKNLVKLALTTIFGNNALLKPTPVIWKGSNGQLRLLIHQLQNQHLIEEIPDQGHWEITRSWFKKSNGETFTNNELRLAKYPANQENILRIVQHLCSSTP